MQPSPRADILKTSDYEFTLERVGNLLFMHCTVHNWNKAVYKDILNSWDMIKKGFIKSGVTELYAARLDDDVLLQRFATRAGFEEAQIEALDADGNIRKVMKCELV